MESGQAPSTPAIPFPLMLCFDGSMSACSRSADEYGHKLKYV